MTLWTLQQYVDANNSYAVRLTRLLAPPPAPIATVAPTTVLTGRTGLTLNVGGGATAGRGFFDPGAGFVRRIGAAFSGAGVTVTNVAVNSPTSLTLTVNPAADAALGVRSLTVTNPDGQTSSLGTAIIVDDGVNQPPAFGTVPADRTLFDAGAGASTGPIPFTVTDPESTAVIVTAATANPAVIPPARIALGGGGLNRTVTVSSVGTLGSSVITLTASDGLLAVTTSFVVTVSVSTVPGPPQGLTATAARNVVVFNWQTPSSAAIEPVTGYLLEAGFGPGQVVGTLTLGNVTVYGLNARAACSSCACAL